MVIFIYFFNLLAPFLLLFHVATLILVFQCILLHSQVKHKVSTVAGAGKRRNSPYSLMGELQMGSNGLPGVEQPAVKWSNYPKSPETKSEPFYN